MLLIVLGFLMVTAMVILLGPPAMDGLAAMLVSAESPVGFLEQIARRLDFVYIQGWPLAFVLMALTAGAFFVRCKH